MARIPTKPIVKKKSTEPVNNTNSAQSALDIAINKANEVAKAINTEHGEPTVFSPSLQLPPVKKYSSGSIVIDKILGGGVPEGRIIEISGAESSGKTTIAFYLAAQQLRLNKAVLVLDYEHALNSEWAKKNGLDLDNPLVFVSQPETAEKGFEIAKAFIETGVFGLIIIDSIAAMETKAQFENAIGAATVGELARFLSNELRGLNPLAAKYGVNLICINQLRDKVQMGGMSYGDPTTTPGGRALKFYASVRLSVARIQTLKVTSKDEKEGAIGNVVKIETKKNKVAPPFKKGQVTIMFDSGLSPLTEIINCGVETEIVKKGGAYYKYGEITLGQGVQKAREFLRENPEIAYKIEQEIRKFWRLPMLDYMPNYEAFASASDENPVVSSTKLDVDEFEQDFDEAAPFEEGEDE